MYTRNKQTPMPGRHLRGYGEWWLGGRGRRDREGWGAEACKGKRGAKEKKPGTSTEVEDVIPLLISTGTHIIVEMIIPLCIKHTYLHPTFSFQSHV